MNLALFDFDGTITTREMFPDFVKYVVTPRRLALGRIVLAPLGIGYKLGVLDGSYVRARVVDFAFRDVDAAPVLQAGERFAQDVLPGVVRTQARERIDWHRQQGDTIVVVSGSFDLYLSHWCRQHDLDLLCSELETRDGRLTGRYRGPQCVGAEKARRVRERYDLGAYDTVYAYGDTEEDRALLAIAHRRYYRWRELG